MRCGRGTLRCWPLRRSPRTNTSSRTSPALRCRSGGGCPSRACCCRSPSFRCSRRNSGTATTGRSRRCGRCCFSSRSWLRSARSRRSHNVAHAILLEYIPFLTMLFALFTIAGGICFRGALAGTPGGQYGPARAGNVPRERHGDDRSGDAADPAVARRQRDAAAQGARRRLLHPPGRQRGRRTFAAGGSAAVHRLPEGRRLLLDDARAGDAYAVPRRRAARALLRARLGAPSPRTRPRRPVSADRPGYPSRACPISCCSPA